MDEVPKGRLHLQKLIDAGRKLTEADVVKLESELNQDQSNVECRVKLIAFYFGRHFNDKRILPTLAKHILWFIENNPEHEILNVPETAGMTLANDHQVFSSLKNAWELRVVESWGDAKLLANAANFFTLVDKRRVIRLLERAVELEPENKRMLERLAHTYELASDSGEDKVFAQRATELRLLLAERFDDPFRDCALANLSEAAYASGDTEKASLSARQVLQMIGETAISQDSVHIAHTILGQIALDAGDLKDAESELLASGEVTGSPVLGSFGPKFVLARKLLEKGSRKAVRGYLIKCSRFWKSGQADLAYWLLILSLGGKPSLDSHCTVELFLPRWLNRPSSAILKILR